MKVTQYRYNKGNLVSRTVDLDATVKSIQTETKDKPVSTMRQNIRFTFPNKENKYVEKLPVIVWGATFYKNGKAPQIRCYSGLVLLEINYLADISEAMQIRKQASEMPQTLLAFIGSTGKSVKIIVPFTLPNGSLPYNKDKIELFHAHAYRLAVKYYQPQLERNITLKDPLPTRGCRMSFDPDLWYNPQAVSIRMDQPAKFLKKEELQIIPEAPQDPLLRLFPGKERNNIIATLYSVALVEAIRNKGKIESSNMAPLFIELAQNCYKSGIPEEDAIQYTLLYEDVRSRKEEIRMAFRSVYLTKKLTQSKTGLPDCMTLVLQLEEFMHRRYQFRFNEMSGDVEYRDRSIIRFGYQPFTIKSRNSICIEAQKEGINVWDKDVERYIRSDAVPAFHPIEDYLQNLPQWNGNDYIRNLADRILCENPYWRDQFYRWFLSMVAHWLELDKEHGNSTSPLLVGKQGCGKSTFCFNLLPPELRSFYTDSIDFSNRREAELALHRYALINIDEFDSVKASHQSFLKHILQKAVVNTRLPYQSTTRQLRRYATFIATSNNFDLLTDPTGSRRFICIEVNGVIDYKQPIDYEQLYAQAIEALASNERYWFSHEEEAIITSNNRCFQQIPGEEQFFLQFFRAAQNNEEGEALLSVEILARIKQRQPDFTYSNTLIRSFGRLIKKNDIPFHRTRRGTCYHVVEI